MEIEFTWVFAGKGEEKGSEENRNSLTGRDKGKKMAFIYSRFSKCYCFTVENGKRRKVESKTCHQVYTNGKGSGWRRVGKGRGSQHTSSVSSLFDHWSNTASKYTLLWICSDILGTPFFSNLFPDAGLKWPEFALSQIGFQSKRSQRWRSAC